MVLKRFFFGLFLVYITCCFQCNEAQDHPAEQTNENSNANYFNRDLLAQSASHMFQVTIPDEPLISKLKNLNIPALRFPGGTGSNFYHFYGKGYGFNKADFEDVKNYPPYEKMIVRWDKEQKFIEKGFASQNYAHRFADLALELECPIVLVMNMYSGTDDENLDLIRFFHEKGIEIRGIEFGNENYFRSFSSVFNSVHEYIDRCQKLSVKIKKEFPSLKLALTAANPPFDSYPALKERFEEWNTELAKHNFYDAIVVHFYIKSPSCRKIDDLEEKFNCTKDNCVNYSEKWLSEGLDYFESVFSDKPIWLTEYNILEVYTDYGNTALQGIYTADFLLRIAKEKRIEMAIYHVLYTYSFGFAMLSHRRTGPKERVSYKIFEMLSDIDASFMLKDFSIESLDLNNCNYLLLYSPSNKKYILLISNLHQEKFDFQIPMGLEVSAIEIESLSGQNLYSSFGKNAIRDDESWNDMIYFKEDISTSSFEIGAHSFTKLEWSKN